MTTQTFVDPWDIAENAKEPQYTNDIWGQVEAKSWYCVLERGIGKIEFDPKNHSQDQRRVAIDIVIHPLTEMELAFDIGRNMIAESHEWANFVLPSIRNIGIHPRELNGKWVKAQVVALTDKNGKPITYTNGNGVIKEKTTIKFIKLFTNYEECQADYLAQSGKSLSNENDNKERQTALAFLKAYVQNVCRGQKDLKTIRETLTLDIAKQPLINKYFTIESPETVELITQYMR